MINLVIGGFVGNDARELEHGCVFSIAHTEKEYAKKDGSIVPEKTQWIDVFAHKNLAPHIKKSQYIIASTNKPIVASIYEGNVSLSINANSIEFGGKGGN